MINLKPSPLFQKTSLSKSSKTLTEESNFVVEHKNLGKKCFFDKTNRYATIFQIERSFDTLATDENVPKPSIFDDSVSYYSWFSGQRDSKNLPVYYLL